jgi:hypothetical protein
VKRSVSCGRERTESALDMIVVADTSPINYLVLIRQIDLLTQLYKQILIPTAVLAELEHPGAPKAVRDWAVSRPPWLEVLKPKTTLMLAELDSGESEALALAAEVHPTWYSSTTMLEGRKRFVEDSKLPARSRFSMKQIRPDLSFSMRQWLNCFIENRGEPN